MPGPGPGPGDAMAKKSPSITGYLTGCSRGRHPGEVRRSELASLTGSFPGAGVAARAAVAHSGAELLGFVCLLLRSHVR